MHSPRANRMMVDERRLRESLTDLGYERSQKAREVTDGMPNARLRATLSRLGGHRDASSPDGAPLVVPPKRQRFRWTERWVACSIRVDAACNSSVPRAMNARAAAISSPIIG